MIVIVDERHFNRHKIMNDEVVVDIDSRIMRMSEFVVVIKDDSYQVLKDRYTGETHEFPLDELPELVKQRLIISLSGRNNPHEEDDD